MPSYSIMHDRYATGPGQGRRIGHAGTLKVARRIAKEHAQSNGRGLHEYSWIAQDWLFRDKVVKHLERSRKGYELAT